MERGIFESVDTESLVPAEHLLRKIDVAVDFNKIYDMVEPLYCADNGHPSVDPVVRFKMVLLQHLYGLGSLRRAAEEVRANIYYRWFLDYRLQEETPHFSTISYNFCHRFTSETADQIFNWILVVEQFPQVHAFVADRAYKNPHSGSMCMTSISTASSVRSTSC